MKKVKNKKIIFILILLIVISSTVAYLYSSDTFQNIFVAASYKVTVTETFESPDNWKPGDTTPKTATLKNEGTVPIKVRVKLDEVWKDSNNQDLPLQHNEENVAIINFSNEDDYIYKDGYYYYDLALNPGETTSSIIESVTFNPNYSGTVTCIENDDSTHTCSSSESGYEGGTYKLTLTIEGVQEDYYVQAWGLSGLVQHQYLYNILQDEAENGGLARKYTGEHHDSFTEESSKDIYHWYASNNVEGPQIFNKNNVVFGNHCWHMIRTTDTGGVKMIYNGEAENNQCLDTRGYHVGYDQGTGTGYSRTMLNANYWYGTDFTYDSTAKTFKVSGTTEQKVWNNSTYEGLIGKYTCKSSNEAATCSTLYLIDSYYNATQAHVIPLKSNSSFYQFGTIQYNPYDTSITYGGYMYGDVYDNNRLSENVEIKKSHKLFDSESGSTNYWYADSISYDSTTGNYSLVNPYKISSPTEYSSLIGKYTLKSTSDSYSNSDVYYITNYYESKMYYLKISNGNLLTDYEPIIIGDSITDNGDGTYTLNNTISVSLVEYGQNCTSYRRVYLCNNNTTVCDKPRFIPTNASRGSYPYIEASENILISKSRNGTNLIDTLLVRKDEFLKNKDNYADYKYTCNTTTDICTSETIQMIDRISNDRYYALSNRYYGSSVIWDGSNYTLVDPKHLEEYNDSVTRTTHHYFCEALNTTTCSTVGYVYNKNTVYIKYIILKNGIIKIDDVLENMLTKNTNNSMIKTGLEAWYKHYMLQYDKYIEDTIYCNDRSINDYVGWKDNGGIIDTYSGLIFYQEGLSDKLNCINVEDQFSTYNNQAKLEYKSGLLTAAEFNLKNKTTAHGKETSYWLSTPSSYNEITYGNMASSGSMSSQNIEYGDGLRPVISLVPKIEYTTGDGSKDNPYIVKMD